MSHSLNRTTRRALLLGAGAAGAAAALAGTGQALAAPTQDALEPDAFTPDVPPSTMALSSFSRIDGVPVYYYTGNSLRTWYCREDFHDTLEEWMRDLRRATPSFYGSVSYIRSLGFYDGDPPSSQHAAGTAMDLTGIRWSSGRVSSMTNHDHTDARLYIRRRYLAVDATLRMRFHVVLNGWFNAAHANHFHADFESLPTVVRTSARSDAFFAQAVTNTFTRSLRISVDGIWGPQTNTAWNYMRSRLGVTGSTASDPEQYRKMLRAIAAHGFNDRYID